MSPILNKDFYNQTTEEVAKALLGKTLVRVLDDGTRLSGIVVEVEAYLSIDDAASHSAIGCTRRNASMFSDPGMLYVYSIHNRHCMNVVTEPSGIGSAVLIRAVEPVEGVERMLQARKQPSGVGLTVATARSIATGPGRLCQALEVDRNLDATELTLGDQLYLEAALDCIASRSWQIHRSPRIGISKAQEKLLRFFIDGHQLVSGCARDHSSGRTWTFKNLLK